VPAERLNFPNSIACVALALAVVTVPKDGNPMFEATGAADTVHALGLPAATKIMISNEYEPVVITLKVLGDVNVMPVPALVNDDQTIAAPGATVELEA
jgi:hypothetical protein